MHSAGGFPAERGELKRITDGVEWSGVRRGGRGSAGILRYVTTYNTPLLQVPQTAVV